MRAGYNSNSRVGSTTTSVLRPRFPASLTSYSFHHSSLTARTIKFIRQISLGEFVWFAGRIVREVFVLPKQLARTNICSSATSPVPSPRTNSSAPLLALKQYWRELKWIVEAFIPRRVSHRSQGVLLLQSQISARFTRRKVFIWIWNFASQCVPCSSIICLSSK